MIALQIAFVKVFELSMSAAAVAAIVLLFRRVVRRRIHPSWLIWLWMILLVKLLFPLSVPGLAGIEDWTDRYIYQQRYGVGWVMNAAADYWNEVRFQGHSRQSEASALPGYENGNEKRIGGFHFDEEANSNRRTGEAHTQLLTAISAVWLIGCLVRAGVGWRNARGMKLRIRRALPCRDAVAIRLLRECKTEVGISSPVELLLGGTVFPFLYGLFKPRIILPYDFKEHYTETELRFILLHELQHWKMKDGCLQLAANLVRLLHWFNPLVHMAFNRLGDDVELRCDRRVTRTLSGPEKAAYGQLLLKQGELNCRLAPRRRIGSAVHWLERQSVLAERVRAVALSICEVKATRRQRAAIGILAFIVGLCMLPGGSDFAQRTAAANPQPTLYAFWLDESVNPRSMRTVREMSVLMAGQAGTASDIVLLLRQPQQKDRLAQWLASIRMLLVDERHPVSIETRPILQGIGRREMRQGKILVFLYYPYYNGKWMGISGGKRSITDLSTLELVQRINLY
ncbi:MULTISPECIES: M56 family metallopeptidase [unclassified Paenibacillus]|uniref:M56 family metallopeptidase n=1 Tax=unclassified Paenibacillus TaxID=185978 RepID=UPI001C0FC9FC|nr:MULTISPECIES: M56 family metallopeptidase [unclassified Paenibacillus]MBU5444540.1 M56 family metallopeptidase [Paenibacillus sp. MSJ-34]CAH0120849.1 hypothetical protein PAE9249_03373 [Paenibacillus sp. CECT 9249]